MVSMLPSSAIDRGFDPRSGKTKDYKIGICCFSAKHAVLRRKNKDWLDRNQDNVSVWGDFVKCGGNIGVKPLIHQLELRTYTKEVPFQEKSSFHFVVYKAVTVSKIIIRLTDLH